MRFGIDGFVVGVIAAAFVGASASAAPVVGSFADRVDARANLFHTDWGHGFTAPIPTAYSSNTPDLDLIGVGTGLAARAFEMAPGVALPFSPGQRAEIEAPAWSWVVDLAVHGTDAFGVPVDPTLAGDPAFKLLYGFAFRGLRVYSLVGMWSTSPTALVPLAPVPLGAPDDLPFLVGYGIDLVVPGHAGPLYLFLGENDGYFDDNASAYDVTVTLRAAEVAAPASLALLAGALVPLVRDRRRRR